MLFDGGVEDEASWKGQTACGQQVTHKPGKHPTSHGRSKHIETRFHLLFFNNTIYKEVYSIPECVFASLCSHRVHHLLC